MHRGLNKNKEEEEGKVVQMLREKTGVTVIKGGQLSPRASVIARCRALVLMCLFCCKQLFLHVLILMIMRRKCVIFGCHSCLFFSFPFLLNVVKDREDKAK